MISSPLVSEPVFSSFPFFSFFLFRFHSLDVVQMMKLEAKAWSIDQELGQVSHVDKRCVPLRSSTREWFVLGLHPFACTTLLACGDPPPHGPRAHEVEVVSHHSILYHLNKYCRIFDIYVVWEGLLGFSPEGRYRRGTGLLGWSVDSSQSWIVFG